MRIVLRTSGGRGEYEIAGSHYGISREDLYDHWFVVELLPGIKLESDNVLRLKSGKPRIRLERRLGDGKAPHLYLTLSAALLLPKPIREISTIEDGNLQIREEGFSVTNINLVIIEMSDVEVVVRVTDLILENGKGHRKRLDVTERLKLLLQLYEVSDHLPRHINLLVQNHHQSLYNGGIDTLIKVTKEIRKHIHSDQDPLPQLMHEANVTDLESYNAGLHASDVEEYINEDDNRSPSEANRENILKWRQIAVRGASGQKFRRDVMDAYNYRCLFTGYYLPKTPLTGSAGVDAAHILPWAEFRLNTTQNGLCLNKICHWAFDNGIFKLDYDKHIERYILSVPGTVKELGQKGVIDIHSFLELEGEIPVDRLPRSKSMWPDPKYLKSINQVY
jgi:hypothetical protein